MNKKEATAKLQKVRAEAKKKGETGLEAPELIKRILALKEAEVLRNSIDFLNRIDEIL